MKLNLGYFLDSGASYVRIQAPAKLNLFLEVLGKRPDGFHEIETVMCPISLCDRILVESSENQDITLDLELPEAEGSVSLSPNGEKNCDPAWDIPAGEQNLVVRAAKRLRDVLGVKDGVRISLDKHIPASAGLGGGSSDTAAVLAACAHLWSGWDREAVTQVANEFGSDIAFFLGDSEKIGMAVGRGRGELCEQLDESPPLTFLVTHPPSGCSTQLIYQGFRPQETTRQSDNIVAACKSGQYQMIGAELFNALQSAARGTTPWIDRQLDLLKNQGFEHVLMSGSGSSCFALKCNEEDQPRDCEESQDVLRLAIQLGIERVYEVSAWYAPSIERQLTKD